MRNSSNQNNCPYGVHKDIYEIFVDYYGENNIDFQYDEDDETADIIVHFPEVTVSNEHGNSVKIQDLFAKVTVDDEGCMVGYFKLRRTSFPLSQVYADYCHSHLCGIVFDWDTPCLGYGPIRNTIESLNETPDHNKWRLFCYELDKYVGVESLQGVPYRYLEKISTKESYRLSLEYNRSCIDIFIENRNSVNIYDVLHSLKTGVRQLSTLRDFLAWFLCNNILPFRLLNNYYTIATSFFSFRLLLSNSFIYWVNHVDSSSGALLYKDLKDTGYLVSVFIENGRVYLDTREHGISMYHGDTKKGFLERYQDKEAFPFRGASIHYKFTDDMETTKRKSPYTLFSLPFTTFVLHKILSFLNYGILQYSSECPKASFSEYSINSEIFVL